MGSILSRFRAKKTTKELLERIEGEIQAIQDYKWSTSRRQKNMMGLLLFSSVVVYIVVALVCYFVYLPSSQTWAQSIVYSLPLVIFPFITWFLRQMIQWYYRWVIDTQEDRLKDLKKEKKRILDKVMETETYKVAKELFEQFDPNRLKDKETDQPDTAKAVQNPNLRFRQVQRTSPTGPIRPMVTPSVVRPGNFQSPNPGAQPMIRSPYMGNPRLARPILPQDRGVMDKLVDFVVGDGPSNRYALICRMCGSHNGMALKEEFEYLAFRCCYCMQVNPARKQRPFAPKLSAVINSETQSNRSSVSASVPTTDDEREDKDESKQSPMTRVPPKTPAGGDNGTETPAATNVSRIETESEPEMIDAEEVSKSDGQDMTPTQENQRLVQ